MPLDANRDASTALSQLQAEVDAQQQMPEEATKVSECLNDFLTILHLHVEDPLSWKIAAFGSAVNGFGSRGSDIDAVAYQDLAVGQNASSPKAVLKALQEPLGKSDRFSVKQAIMGARVPILKLRYKGDQDVDLSVNNTSPLPNTRLLKAYAGLGKCVVDFGVAVKLWAKSWKVCGAAGGNLSSYAFLMLAIYFLQVTASKLPCLQRDGNDAFESDENSEAFNVAIRQDGWHSEKQLPDLLQEFFDFYANEFNWGTEVVSVRLGRRETTASPDFKELRFRDKKWIHIEDPFIRQRNLSDVLGIVQETMLWEGFRAAASAMRDGKYEDVFSGKARSTGAHLRRWGQQWGSKDKTKEPDMNAGQRWSRHKGKGHTLPRLRVTDDTFTGHLVEWKGKYGWLMLDCDLEIGVEDTKNRGRIFVSMSDVRCDINRLRVGSKCCFYVFKDESGLGAECLDICETALT